MILVTGGTGLLGAHLIYDLLAAGEQVRATKRATSKLEIAEKVFDYYPRGKELYRKIQWVEADVLDVPALEHAFEGVDKVYHCAAFVSFNKKHAKRLLQINIEGTTNVVNLALSSGVKKFCHVSSTAAIGHTNDEGELITETTKWKLEKNTSNYSISKYYSEREVWRAKEEGLNMVIVNPCIILGPGDWGKSSTSFFPTVWRGMRYYTMGGNAFVDVRDVSACMIKLMESEICNERFLITGENMSFRNFFDQISEQLGKPKPTIKAGPVKTSIAWRLEKIRSLLTGDSQLITRETANAAQESRHYSNEKIKKAMGVEFRSVGTSIVETSQRFLEDVKRTA